MSTALLSGVSGMKAHQKMIDVAGNNLANLNTTAFKASRVTFADLLSQTIAEASQPTGAMGGTNPMQLGSGVKLASVDRNMAQGSLVYTGEPLDVAIEGKGYFVVNDGQQDVYTRVGGFAVDSEYYLVDPGTGYRVQRTGSEGVADGFQDGSNSAIRVPYDMPVPPKSTEEITYNGNLSSDEIFTTTPTNMLSSVAEYTEGGAGALDATKLVDLDQATGTIIGGDIEITGADNNGTPIDGLLSTSYGGAIDANTSVGDLLAAINALYTGSTATITNGEIRLTDTQSGYSLTDVKLSLTGATGDLALPKYFRLTPGSTMVGNTNIQIFDSQGVSHNLAGSFIRTDTANMWDFVVTEISGDVDLVDRRIHGMTFLANGNYGGLDETIADTATLEMKFAADPATTRTISVNLGAVGKNDGVSQTGGATLVSAAKQDGYPSGGLSSISVTREGVLVGVFTNGERKDLASMKIAVFQNAAGLEAIGGNYFTASANSGDPVPTKGQSGGAGAVHGGSLEGSNVDIAAQFVALIQAQNGYQANARTIKVTNDMLRELTNLVR